MCACNCGSQRTTWGSVLSFYPVGFWNWAQVIKHDVEHLHPLSHPASRACSWDRVLELTICSQGWFTCFHILSATMMGRYCHTQSVWCWGLRLGLHACQADTTRARAPVSGCQSCRLCFMNRPCSLTIINNYNKMLNCKTLARTFLNWVLIWL